MRWRDLEQATKLDPNNTETKQLRAQAQMHVDEKIKEARAKELAPETGTVKLPVAPPEAVATPAAPKGEAPPVATGARRRRRAPRT